MEKIFVSIISCKEKFLQQTIKSAINNAEFKERVFIGVFNTVLEYDKAEYLNYKNVELNNFYSSNILGVGLSRKKSLEMCPEDIDYVLQVDAHMVFENGWDSYLINSIKSLEKNHNQIIISQMLATWLPKEDGKVFLFDTNRIENPNNVPVALERRPYVLRYGDSILQEYPLTQAFLSDWGGKNFLESGSICGAFVFSRKKMFDEIPHDERCTWGADEGVFAMRAWTRGYKIFTVKRHVAFHLNKGEYGYEKDWRNNLNTNDSEWWEKTYKTIENINTGKELGLYGAQSKEILEDYEKFVNFNFKDFYKKLAKEYNF